MLICTESRPWLLCSAANFCSGSLSPYTVAVEIRLLVAPRGEGRAETAVRVESARNGRSARNRTFREVIVRSNAI
jgi:hypothetical protein